MKINNPEYIPGNHWMICDECGLRYRRSEIMERWDGAMVCEKDYEPKHPQESIRVTVDRVAVDVARPDGMIGNRLAETPATLGDGWTNNGEGSFSADGEYLATKEVTWTGIITDAGTYRLHLSIMSTDDVGSVQVTSTELETGWITKDSETVQGTLTTAYTVALQCKGYFEGTVSVSLIKVITQDDL